MRPFLVHLGCPPCAVRVSPSAPAHERDHVLQYAQRLLATLPVTRAGLRAILAVLTAFGIVLTTAGVAAMPLLNAGNVVEDYERGSACHPIDRMVYT